MAADTWHKGTTHPLAWDAVTTYEDGSPIDGETVSYNLYLKNVQTNVQIKVGSTSESSLTVVIPERGRYRFGVQAALGEDVSEIMWSDNALACEGGQTFGARWMNPNWPRNFRRP